MKRNGRVAIGIITLVLLLMSCQKEDEKTIDVAGKKSAINQWIETTMRDNYLWNTEIPAANKLNYSAGAEDFFRSLLTLKDGKARGTSHHYYSYIEKNKDYTATRTSIDQDDTYGMEFTAYVITDSNNQPLGYYWVRVLYVLPNSPAQAIGLKRGDWIVGFNGKNNNLTQYSNLLRGGGLTLTVAANPRDVENYKQVSLVASRKVEDNPLYVNKIIETGGRKIGYLLYNHFTTGPDGYTDRTYDEQMKTIFKRFVDQGVNEFVLDLRYNGGGYLISANILASLLVPEKNKNDIFSIDTDNKGRQSKRYFSSEGATTHLNIDRLFVLTSRSTASASEAVINGLSPFMDITIIGETTEGKNVGSVHYAKNEYEWALQPIIIRITSSNTSYDYSSGLPADYPCNEFDRKQNLTDELLPLGDENEFMLKKAIELITGNRAASRAPIQEEVPGQDAYQLVYNSVERHQTNGVLVAPDYSRDTFWNR